MKFYCWLQTQSLTCATSQDWLEQRPQHNLEALLAEAKLHPHGVCWLQRIARHLKIDKSETLERRANLRALRVYVSLAFVKAELNVVAAQLRAATNDSDILELGLMAMQTANALAKAVDIPENWKFYSNLGQQNLKLEHAQRACRAAFLAARASSEAVAAVVGLEREEIKAKDADYFHVVGPEVIQALQQRGIQ